MRRRNRQDVTHQGCLRQGHCRTDRGLIQRQSLLLAGQHLVRQKLCEYSPSLQLEQSSHVQDKDKILLADIGPMFPLPKIVPPIESQLPNESRRQWASVTEAILDRDFSRATAAKQDIEEGQRGKTAERKAQNQEWRPRFFENATDASGRPRLTVEGRTALDRVHNSDWRLEHGVQS